MPRGGRPSVQLWAALGSRCQRLCFSPMKFTPSLLKSALLLDPVTNESNLGWVPLTWPWPRQTIGQTQPVEKMFCTNEPSGGHRSVKKEGIWKGKIVEREIGGFFKMIFSIFFLTKQCGFTPVGINRIELGGVVRCSVLVLLSCDSFIHGHLNSYEAKTGRLPKS